MGVGCGRVRHDLEDTYHLAIVGRGAGLVVEEVLSSDECVGGITHLRGDGHIADQRPHLVHHRVTVGDEAVVRVGVHTPGVGSDIVGHTLQESVAAVVNNHLGVVIEHGGGGEVHRLAVTLSQLVDDAGGAHLHPEGELLDGGIVHHARALLHDRGELFEIAGEHDA